MLCLFFLCFCYHFPPRSKTLCCRFVSTGIKHVQCTPRVVYVLASVSQDPSAVTTDVFAHIKTDNIPFVRSMLATSSCIRSRDLSRSFHDSQRLNLSRERESTTQTSYNFVAGFPAIWLIAVSAMAVEKALTLLRARLCDPTYVHAAFKSCPQSNYRCHSPPYLPVETLPFLFPVLNLMDFPVCPVVRFSISI